MTPIDRQLAQHIADPTLRHPLDSPRIYQGYRPCECPPAKNVPRFLYAPRREPREGMIDRHYYEWIDSKTGLRVESESMCGFFEWCEGILDSEQRS